jgi:hypothetical protein
MHMSALAIAAAGGRWGGVCCPCCFSHGFSFEIIFFRPEDGTRIDGRNILQINDHDLLCHSNQTK